MVTTSDGIDPNRLMITADTFINSLTDEPNAAVGTTVEMIITTHQRSQLMRV